MRRKPKTPPRQSSRYPDDRYTDDYEERPTSKSPIMSALNYGTIAILLAVFVIGVGIGIAFSSTTTFSPERVASTEQIDRSAPNPQLCAQFGAGAIAMDLRAFVTFNPFAIYVSQPAMQPGCVLRSTNWSLLERRNLVTSQEVSQCRQRLNTFGFTGDIERGNGNAKIDCIYQNDAAQNLFLDQPGVGAPPAETNRF